MRDQRTEKIKDSDSYFHHMIAAECCSDVMAGCIGSLDYPVRAMNLWELEDRHTPVDAYCR